MKTSADARYARARINPRRGTPLMGRRDRARPAGGLLRALLWRAFGSEEVVGGAFKGSRAMLCGSTRAAGFARTSLLLALLFVLVYHLDLISNRIHFDRVSFCCPFRVGVSHVHTGLKYDPFWGRIARMLIKIIVRPNKIAVRATSNF